MESILTSVKKLLGIPEAYTHFDTDIIMHINSTFMILNQLGIGPDEIFKIEDSTTEWSEFTSDERFLEPVKSYMGYRVKLLFDPPDRSNIMESINKCMNELEWRLTLAAEEKRNSREEANEDATN